MCIDFIWCSLISYERYIKNRRQTAEFIKRKPLTIFGANLLIFFGNEKLPFWANFRCFDVDLVIKVPVVTWVSWVLFWALNFILVISTIALGTMVAMDTANIILDMSDMSAMDVISFLSALCNRCYGCLKTLMKLYCQNNSTYLT